MIMVINRTHTHIHRHTHIIATNVANKSNFKKPCQVCEWHKPDLKIHTLDLTSKIVVVAICKKAKDSLMNIFLCLVAVSTIIIIMGNGS